MFSSRSSLKFAVLCYRNYAYEHHARTTVQYQVKMGGKS